MRKAIVCCSLLVLFIGFLAFISCAMAEEDSAIVSAAPNIVSYDFGKRFDVEKEGVKNSSFYTLLLPYIAVRYENLSMLGTEATKQYAQRALNMRYLGEKRCELITETSVKDICIAMRNNNCSTLPAADAAICEAGLKDDADAMFAARNHPSRTARFGKVEKEEVLKEMAIAAGYKFYNAAVCERYTTALPLSDKVGCRILFANNPDQEIDNILTDIVYVTKAKEEGDLSYCKKVQNQYIQQACQRCQTQDLKDLW